MSYIAEFTDGPLQGTTEHRELVDGQPEQRIKTYVLVEGVDAQLEYVASGTRTVGDTLFVDYTFDPADSDPYSVDDEEPHITS